MGLEHCSIVVSKGVAAQGFLAPPCKDLFTKFLPVNGIGKETIGCLEEPDSVVRSLVWGQF